jgi:hypothetical protein
LSVYLRLREFTECFFLAAQPPNHLSPSHFQFQETPGLHSGEQNQKKGKVMIYNEDNVPNPKNQQDELLDRVAAAKYLGNVKPHTLAVWHSTKRHDLKPIKIGKLVRYKRSVLDDFIKERMTP